jgi:peptidoglycan/LPS O-acetylase OafA/YrhL
MTVGGVIERPQEADDAAPPLERAQTEITHYPFVDALRGWAFLGVLMIHTLKAVPNCPRWLMRIAGEGQFGVRLFFVASAFTLFLSLDQRSTRDRRPLSSFYIRRFFRIAPMFWVATLYYLIKGGFSSRYYAPAGIGWGQVAATLGFVHGWHPAYINSITPGGWSITVEMMFYLLVPWLFHRLVNIRAALVATICVVLGSVAIDRLVHPWLLHRWPADQAYLVDAFTYYWLPSQLPVFCLGFLLFWVLKRRVAASGTGLLLIVLGTYVYGMFCFQAHTPLLPEHVGRSIGFMLVAWGLSLYPMAALVNPITRFLGKISYSAYLMHFSAVELCVPWCAAATRGWASWRGAAAAFTVCLLTTVVFASVTWRLIEEPGRLLGKRLVARINRQPS